MSIHIYAQEDIDSRDAQVRGMPGTVYEQEVQSLVRCDWSPITRTWSVHKDRLGDLRVALDRARIRYTTHDTGCPPPPMVTKERAQYLVNSIRSGLAGLYPLVIEAYEGRAWDPLGYTSWKALCEAQFALTLAIPQRREAVQEMTEAGMSTRAQAEVLGVSHQTVIRDRVVQSGPVTHDTTGLDGRVYSAERATTTYSWEEPQPEPEPTPPPPAPVLPLRGDVRIEAALTAFADDDITATPSRIHLLRGACQRWLDDREEWDHD